MNEYKPYKIGQRIIADKDIVVITFITGEKKIIKKGTEGIITKDGCVRWGTDNITIEDREVKGYDKENIAKFITYCLEEHFGKEVFETLEDSTDISKSDITEQIEYALDEIL